jgi:AcrR family transcriptional regulator
MRIQSSGAPPVSRADEAVLRAVRGRHEEATQEVERALAAAVTVMARVAPAEPRVSDIVREAGLSNKAFYRYFDGKEDLILAVLERGVHLLESYLAHQMAKTDDAEQQIARWIEGVLAQAADAKAARATRAVTNQVALVAHRRGPDHETTMPLRTMLTAAIARAGSADPGRDGDAVFEAVFNTMRRHLAAGTRPTPTDTRHLVAFCLRGIRR